MIHICTTYTHIIYLYRCCLKNILDWEGQILSDFKTNINSLGINGSLV